MDRPVKGWNEIDTPARAGRGGVWAETPVTGTQKAGLAGIGVLAAVGFAFWPALAAEILIGALILLASGHMIFRCLLWAVGVSPQARPLARRADSELPVYSIIVPLYREANMAARLVDALERLDYPRDRLDILVALEPDDCETQAAFETLDLGAHWRVLVAPPGSPRTKPRACNAALTHALGAFTVVFDAEDRPEPQQLRDAVAIFDHGGERLACLQARLFPFNAQEKVITRLFALDFALWFDAMLSGLRRLGFPVPLGGTSNHFRTGTLRLAGGWDAWNVTEDADLGLRLGRLGHQVATLDSTTWEEAPVSLSAWLPQRTRWSRGYMQTFFVHARAPKTLNLPALGVRGWFFLIFFVGASSVFALVNPAFWALASWQALTGEAPLNGVFGPVVGPLAMGLMLGGNLLSLAMAVLAPLRRRMWALAPWGLLAPVYWAMIAWAAWRALVLFFRDPFRWEKTPHGLTRRGAA